VADHRKRLQIVDDHDIVGEVVPDDVLVDHLFVDPLFPVGEVDLAALEGIVHLLRDAEKIGRPLDHPPAGLDSKAVHEQRLGGQEFRDAASVIRRIDVSDVKIPERFRFLQDSFDRFRPDVRLEILHLHDPIRLHDPPHLPLARFR
jgi:hypothetical protein